MVVVRAVYTNDSYRDRALGGAMLPQQILRRAKAQTYPSIGGTRLKAATTTGQHYNTAAQHTHESIGEQRLIQHRQQQRSKNYSTIVDADKPRIPQRLLLKRK
ncbi:unnamed protein product [Ectocarpus sp. 12 AP-2014]